MSVISIPRNMSKACKLYLQRNFDEADKLMDKISDPYRQKSAIEAQLALFRWDFEIAINKCMEFLPYLNEWRSLNMLEASFAMITFCAVHTKKNEVLEYLTKLKIKFETEEDERYRRFVIGSINKSLTYLKGENKAEEMLMQDNLLSVKEAAELWGCKEIDTPNGAYQILSRGYKKIKPNEYIELYERYHNSLVMTEKTRADIIKTYLYMNKTEMISTSIFDLYKYTWLPVEKTTVMPISILTYDTKLWEFYTKELFDKIYTTTNVHFEGAE